MIIIIIIRPRRAARPICSKTLTSPQCTHVVRGSADRWI